MPRNSSDKFAIAHRRQVVARLRLKRYTELEITAELAEQGIVNPKTGKPYSSVTVHNDLRALEREWKEAALVDFDQLKGELLAGLREAERVAWRGRHGRPELGLVLKSLGQQGRLLGFVGADSPASARAREERLVHQATEDFRLGAEAAREVYKAMRANKAHESGEDGEPYE